MIYSVYRLSKVGVLEPSRISNPEIPIQLTKQAMLTAKGKYGLKALVHLATLEPGKTTQAVDIADTNNIPKKFLDAILGDLRSAGIVFSKKGPGGGYVLARAPSEINVGQVIRTLDGPLAPIACASRTAYQPCRDCNDVKTCTVRITMSKVRDAMADILDRLTVADMLAMSNGRKIGYLYNIKGKPDVKGKRAAVRRRRAPPRLG
jgi:Rrf2 family protein